MVNNLRDAIRRFIEKILETGSATLIYYIVYPQRIGIMIVDKERFQVPVEGFSVVAAEVIEAIERKFGKLNLVSSSVGAEIYENEKIRVEVFTTQVRLTINAMLKR